MNERAYVIAKRATDIVIAAAASTLLAPVMLGIALLIRLTMGPPVLFRQLRLGFEGRPFQMLKFRTMGAGRDERGQLLPDRDRLTPAGRFLRALTLDELPEFINVLQGEMSLVGPRPLLPEYWDRYSSRQKRRHGVKPGMTGWAQVRGRNALTWEERFELDLWYVEHRSLWLDLKILAMTAWLVLSRKGISHPGHTTMAPFQGKVD